MKRRRLPANNRSVTADELIHCPVLLQSRYLQLSTREGVHNVQLKDIIYCHSDNSLTTFHLHGHKPIMVSKPLIYYEDLLRQSGFERVHNKRLVNLTHITCLSHGERGFMIELTCGEKIGISRALKKNLVASLRQISVHEVV